MMMNYFSPMDPSTSYYSINWISFLLPLSLMYILVPLSSSHTSSLTKAPYNMLMKEIQPLLKNISTQGTSILFFTIFVTIFLSNLTSLFPHIFTHTSHSTFNLALSFTMWMLLMIYAWTNNTNFMFSHLIPQSSPTLLIPFMALIELISQIIRPLTLSVRLTTNMVAGHLLLTLLASLGPMILLNTYSMVLIPQLILLVLETAVALIQAYVFTVLLVMYTSETN